MKEITIMTPLQEIRDIIRSNASCGLDTTGEWETPLKQLEDHCQNAWDTIKERNLPCSLNRFCCLWRRELEAQNQNG